MTAKPIAAVVFDLDGVVRHFDPEHRAEVEASHSLAPGSLWSAGFEPERIQALVTGRITRAEWVTQIGLAVGSPAAAVHWQSRPARLDTGVMSIVDEVRRLGLPVALCTNGTDTIPDELSDLGVAERFDRVFNSAEIGVAKPDRRIYEHLCRELAADPGSVFFTDDSPRHVDGAIGVGLMAEVFIDAAALRSVLADLIDGLGA